MATPTISNNSPSAGRISWGAFAIQYQGDNFTIPAGNTDKKWVWWVYATNTLQAGDDIPELSADDLLLFSNKSGIGLRVQKTHMIDGELLVNGSIFSDALSTNLINSSHIVTAGLDAGVIKFGSMSGDRIAANTITSAQIVTAGLDAGVIKFGTMSGARITANTIDSNHIITGGLNAGVIKFGTMSGDRITANTINSGHIITTGLDAAVIKFGTMSGDRITANTITSAQIVTAGLDAGVIKFGTMSGARIAANTITATQLAADAITGKTITGGTINGTTITGVTIVGTSLATAPDGTAHIEFGGNGYDNYALWVEASGTETGSIYSGEGSSGYGWIHTGPSTTEAGTPRAASLTYFGGTHIQSNPNQENARKFGGIITARAGQMYCAVPWVLGQDSDLLQTTNAIVDEGLTGGTATAGYFRMNAGFSSVSGQTVAFYYDASGRVEMKGAINRGTHVSGDSVFMLPTRYRPKTTFYTNVRGPNTSTTTQCQLRIDPDGNVRIIYAGTAPNTMGMDCSWSTLF